MKKAIFILLGISVIIGSILLFKAQTNKSTGDAEVSAVRAIVEMYLKEDLNGANLSTDNFTRSSLEKILVAGEEASPGWDNVSLVKSYKIDTIHLSKEKGSTRASATVTYEILGEVPGAMKVIQKNEVEKYVFRLVKQGKEWKLIEPYDLRPHVSVDTVIRHLKTLLGKEDQDKLPDVILQLVALKGHG